MTSEQIHDYQIFLKREDYDTARNIAYLMDCAIMLREIAYQLAVANELREVGTCDLVGKPHQINRHIKFDCNSKVECRNWQAYEVNT